jgi:hypothetical protein
MELRTNKHYNVTLNFMAYASHFIFDIEICRNGGVCTISAGTCFENDSLTTKQEVVSEWCTNAALGSHFRFSYTPSAGTKVRHCQSVTLRHQLEVLDSIFSTLLEALRRWVIRTAIFFPNASWTREPGSRSGCSDWLWDGRPRGQCFEFRKGKI